jgi:hypothetical protein
MIDVLITTTGQKGQLARRIVMAASRGRLPTSVEAALEEIADIEQRISALEQELILEDDDGGKTDEVVEPEASESAAPITDWLPPRFCVPINADVRTFNFKVKWFDFERLSSSLPALRVAVCLFHMSWRRSLARHNWSLQGASLM